MAIKTSTINIFLCMNLLCYVLTAADSCTCTTPSPPSPPPRRGSSGVYGGSGSSGGSAGGSGSVGVPGGSGTSGSSGISGGPGGSGSFRGFGPGQQPATCPIDALKLGVCANLLGGLVGVVVGNPRVAPCCNLLAGLADLEASVCLCTAIRAHLLVINLNVPVSLSFLLNVCGRIPPTGFVCA